MVVTKGLRPDTYASPTPWHQKAPSPRPTPPSPPNFPRFAKSSKIEAEIAIQPSPIASRSPPRLATCLRAPTQFVVNALEAETCERRTMLFAAVVVDLDVIAWCSCCATNSAFAGMQVLRYELAIHVFASIGLVGRYTIDVGAATSEAIMAWCGGRLFVVGLLRITPDYGKSGARRKLRSGSPASRETTERCLVTIRLKTFRYKTACLAYAILVFLWQLHDRLRVCVCR